MQDIIDINKMKGKIGLSDVRRAETTDYTE